MADELSELRRRIDEVDRAIVEALAERRSVVSEVAGYKKEGASFLRDRAREEEHLGELVELGRDLGLDGFFVTEVFRQILDHSVRVQQELLTERPEAADKDTLVVAYQGTDGSYSHLAAQRHFGARDQAATLQGHPTFEEMMESVAAGEADYGVLPVENTTAGSINAAYDLLARMDLAVVGEEIQRVDHVLLAPQPVPLSHIRRIYSQAPALDQCSRFLSGLEHCHAEAFVDTAMAVKKVAEDQDLSQAAIASEEAGRLYGLHVIKRNIANQRENYTRFLVVAREPVRYDLRFPCKTSIIFATGHEEGALLTCLNVLAEHHLNLTKLESRPRPKTPWEYLFYVDFEGNVADEGVREALHELAGRARFLKVLGSYPARNVKETRPAEPRIPPERPSRRAPEAPSLELEVLEALERKPYRLASRAQRAEDTVIHVAGVDVGGERPVVLARLPAGADPAATRAAARAAAGAGARLLHGGRFDERGVAAAIEAGHASGLPVVVSVATPAELRRAAGAADMLRIGARSMQDFVLLEAAGKVDRPILLQRGLMASVDEWLAAAEVVLAHGNQQVVLCEGGIRTFETATHATLDVTAIPVLRERTHLPVVVDPTEAVGRPDRLGPVASAALAAGAHGVVLPADAEALPGLMKRLAHRL
ncbi:MAG: prephenate dehydratase domain-containing protein [Myxococcota bacterium]